ncbi:hypothetical protein ACNKHV_02020 [Shigella flexneri]
MTHGYAGAMVFGIVIVNAARSRGVTEARLLTRYTVWGWPDGGCWSDSLYLAFRLGSDSASLVDQVCKRRCYSACLRSAHLWRRR